MHLEKVDNWVGAHHVTVSNFNKVHHPSQREFFDSPIEVPDIGYSHERSIKADLNMIYAAKTPMRSMNHC